MRPVWRRACLSHQTNQLDCDAGMFLARLDAPSRTISRQSNAVVVISYSLSQAHQTVQIVSLPRSHHFISFFRLHALTYFSQLCFNKIHSCLWCARRNLLFYCFAWETIEIELITWADCTARCIQPHEENQTQTGSSTHLSFKPTV